MCTYLRSVGVTVQEVADRFDQELRAPGKPD
jgi:hypothetical protein